MEDTVETAGLPLLRRFLEAKGWEVIRVDRLPETLPSGEEAFQLAFYVSEYGATLFFGVFPPLSLDPSVPGNPRYTLSFSLIEGTNLDLGSRAGLLGTPEMWALLGDLLPRFHGVGAAYFPKGRMLSLHHQGFLSDWSSLLKTLPEMVREVVAVAGVVQDLFLGRIRA